MHKAFRNRIIKNAIARALSRRSPQTIPLDGPRLETRDYFTTHITHRATKTEHLILEKTEEEYSTLQFNDHGENNEVRVKKVNIEDYHIEIKHYYKNLEILFRNPIAFTIYQLLHVYQIRFFFHGIFIRLMGKIPFARAKRLQILQLLHDRLLEGNTKSIGPDTVLNLIYGRRWRHHPSIMPIYNYCELVLESLVESGDLKKEQYGYKLSAHALTTLSKAEEDDRRHRDMRRLQSLMILLTAFLVIIGALQVAMAAGIQLKSFLGLG
jgi:hypothetical protein